jgi:hypothetical protein
MALSQNEPNAIVCCEDSQIDGLSGLCSLPKVRLEENFLVCCQLTTEMGAVICITMHNQTYANYDLYSYFAVDLNLVDKTTIRGTLGQISRGMASTTLSHTYTDIVHVLPNIRDR